MHVPTNLVAQTAATFTEGNDLYDKLQARTTNEVFIEPTTHIVNPFFVSDKLDALSKYAEKAMGYKLAAHAVAKKVDSDILATSDNFTTTDVNSGGSTITNLDLTEAKARIDENDVPEGDRFWIFNPWVIKDLYDLTGNYFTSMDFGADAALVKGFTGKGILGSPVYLSTNMPSAAAGSPAQPIITNLYAHKDAIGWAAHWLDQNQEDYDLRYQGTLYNVRSMFGCKMLHGAKGVQIKRQSTTG
ncbi:MAG: hypothetical protein FJ045_04200 [Crenarchaeota archaeon]|nr:hypothetical protein [Thermoproteota archaeon]